jgi:hypothetical protein
MKSLSGILGLFILFTSSQAFSWGGRGHFTICEAAVFLVKSPSLDYFVKTRPHMLGHLCNIPDTYWKNAGSDMRKVGDPTHYFNPEKLGLKLEEVPGDFKKIVEQYTGKPSKVNESTTLYSVPEEVGSAWWRADQFYRLALEGAKKAKSGTPPKNYKEEQDMKLPFNEGTYQMLVNMGLMGHFVGDMSQPFHNTSDHDGYAAGHGGIHGYYEEQVVSCFDGDMLSKIIKEAKAMKNPKFTQQKSVVEDLRALSMISYSEIKDALKADKVKSPSVLTIDKGMSSKKIAERREPCETSKDFEKMIIKQMARSSLLLAHLWDQMYEEAGSPKVDEYASFVFPFTPDFVRPDYYEQKEAK